MRSATLAMVVSVALAAPVGAEATSPDSPLPSIAARVRAGARRGRPRKFDVPSRAVTLTLPHATISALQAIDSDISRAIVRVLEGIAPPIAADSLELARIGNDALIIVPRSRALEELTGVDLIPLPRQRALLCFDQQLSIPEFELRLGDALADPAFGGQDRDMFEDLVTILRAARRSGTATLRQRRIIVLQQRAGHEPVASRAATA